MSKKRREKGEGSVYRRKDGRCVGEYEDANGKRRYVSGKTKAGVRAKLRRLLADRDEGVAYDSENLTIGGYLDRWLGALKGSVRDRTWRRHEEVVRLHLTPTLGGVKLDKLNALQVQNVYSQKLNEGLSLRSVEIIHVTLHKALKQAVRWSLAPRNVAEAVTPPRPPKREITPLTQQQLRALLETARNDELYALWVLACRTGMRNGELLALQWRDIDLEAGTLQVKRTVFDGEVSPPKTASGRRTIRLSKLAIAALRQHRTNAAERHTSEWVFSSRTGMPISVHNLHNRSWKPLLERADLPAGTRMHDLRHSAATLLLSKGVAVKMVSEMLGHADVSTTLSIYAHVLPDMQGIAADAADQALGYTEKAP
jgi:integrase